MKLGIGLAHHDHSYVNRRGGWELLTELRGGGVRADYRRRAVDRSFKRFEVARVLGRRTPRSVATGCFVFREMGA
jgi:hypothetical protein